MSAASRTSVIIGTRGRRQIVADCVAALRALDPPAEAILVIDDSPTGRPLLELQGVELHHSHGRGLSAARNLGLRAARSEYVAFIDDDAVPEPGWLERLVAPIASGAAEGTTGRIVPFEDRDDEAYDVFAAIGDFDLGPDPRVVHRETSGWFEMANFGGVGYGGNMAFARPMLSEIGGFPEWLGLGSPINGSEENNVFFHFIESGRTMVYVPDAVVRHPYPGSMQEVRDRYLRDVRRVAGYIAALLVDEPAHRRAVLRYMGGRLRGEPRVWRGQTEKPGPDLAGRVEVVRAALRGCSDYLNARRLRKKLATIRH